MATVTPNPSLKNPSVPPTTPAPGPQSLTGLDVAPNVSDPSPTSQKEPNSTGPANTTNQPLSHSPPPPMVNLQTATNTDSNALGTEPAGEKSVPSTLTPQRGPISSILNDSIWAEVDNISKTFQG